MNKDGEQIKVTGTRPATNNKLEKRPATLGRIVWPILLLAALLIVCWFFLYATDFVKFVLSPWWNSQDQLGVIKNWADRMAIAFGAISAVIALILAFEPKLKQTSKKALGVGAAALTLIVVFFGSISQKISDRLPELSPLQGITGTYNWDGSQTTISAFSITRWFGQLRRTLKFFTRWRNLKAHGTGHLYYVSPKKRKQKLRNG